jgi:putative effector of murein hydrolase LrgA (UPF0299 family)
MAKKKGSKKDLKSKTSKKGSNKKSKNKKSLQKGFTEKILKKRIRLVTKNLILFFVLSIVSLLSYQNVITEYQGLFGVMSIIFSFIFLSFLIALLVFIFLRISNRKNSLK